MVPAHLSVVTLGVADVDQAAAFYTALGWPVLASSSAEIRFLQVGLVVLGLFGRAALAADADVADDPTGFAGVTLSINLPSVTHVNAAARAWVDAGGTVVKPPQAAEWGGYSGYVADLDGHLWELAYNPYSPEWAAVVEARDDA